MNDSASGNETTCVARLGPQDRLHVHGSAAAKIVFGADVTCQKLSATRVQYRYALWNSCGRAFLPILAWNDEPRLEDDDQGYLSVAELCGVRDARAVRGHRCVTTPWRNGSAVSAVGMAVGAHCRCSAGYECGTRAWGRRRSFVCDAKYTDLPLGPRSSRSYFSSIRTRRSPFPFVLTMGSFISLALICKNRLPQSY